MTGPDIIIAALGCISGVLIFWSGHYYGRDYQMRKITAEIKFAEWSDEWDRMNAEVEQKLRAE
jgi:hypothetical protein